MTTYEREGGASMSELYSALVLYVLSFTYNTFISQTLLKTICFLTTNHTVVSHDVGNIQNLPFRIVVDIWRPVAIWHNGISFLTGINSLFLPSCRVCFPSFL